MKFQSRRSLQFSDLTWGPQSPHTSRHPHDHCTSNIYSTFSFSIQAKKKNHKQT